MQIRSLRHPLPIFFSIRGCRLLLLSLHLFLGASKHLYDRIHWSVRPSVGPSICPLCVFWFFFVFFLFSFFGISQNGGKRSKMTLHISSGFLFLSFTLNLSFYLPFTISLSQSFFHNLSFSIFLSQSLFLNHSFTIFLWQSFLHNLSSTFFLPPSLFHNLFFSICIYRSLFQSLQNVGRIVVCSSACLVNASSKDVVYLCCMKKKFDQFVRFFWLEIPSTQNFNTPQQHLIIALNSSYLHLI